MHFWFLAVLFILLASIAVMAELLRISMKDTIYKYINIGFVGGILFLSVMVIMLAVYWITCLRSGGFSVSALYQAMLRFPRQFSVLALFGILAVSVLVGISNVALIRHEGFHPSNALSILIAAFYVLGTGAVYLLLMLLQKYVFVPRGSELDRAFQILNTVIPLFFLLLLCYLECMLAGTAVMGWIAAHQKPSYDKDYIIILGCSIDRRGGLLPLLKGRVNRAVRFAWEQELATEKPLCYVPSGGKGPNEILSEGSAMELYLLSHGAEEDEIFPEKKSRNTWENMVFSRQIIKNLKPDANVAFATTNYHMLRSGILARRAGLDAEGIAGDTKWYFWPNGFVREFFAILKMNVRAHLLVALVLALLCTAVGCAGYFANLL